MDNSQTNTNLQDGNKKPYDLEERSLLYAKDVRTFVRKLPRSISNGEDVKQLVRASGSVGANYIEANEALSKKDAKHRLRIARKEAKESRYWLKLVWTNDDFELDAERYELIQEATELLQILSAMINKT
jgi:four helix bundle protein